MPAAAAAAVHRINVGSSNTIIATVYWNAPWSWLHSWNSSKAKNYNNNNRIDEEIIYETTSPSFVTAVVVLRCNL